MMPIALGSAGGSILFKPDQSTNSSGPIEGTISDDILCDKLMRGSSYVELTVSGDEMNRASWRVVSSRCSGTLQRFDESAAGRPGALRGAARG